MLVRRIREWLELRRGMRDLEEKTAASMEGVEEFIKLLDNTPRGGLPLKERARISRLRAQAEMCLSRQGQLMEAIRERDYSRVTMLGGVLEALNGRFKEIWEEAGAWGGR